MAKVFKLLMPEFDIVLISVEKGICRFSGNNIRTCIHRREMVGWREIFDAARTKKAA